MTITKIHGKKLFFICLKLKIAVMIVKNRIEMKNLKTLI